MSASLQAEGVTVRLGQSEVLTNAAFALREGECVGLIGPNGAGKTTLLRVLAGLIKPGSGNVALDGLPFASWPARERARQVGYLAQAAIAHWPMTVEHIVALGRLPRRDPFRGLSETDTRAVDAALAKVDASHLRDRNVTTLSGGERARVMLARVLAGEPRFLLADEPGAGLDPAHQLRLMEHLSDLAHGGHGVAVVLHDLTLAARYCDRLVLLQSGRVVADGAAGDVMTDHNMATVFGVRCIRASQAGEPLVVAWHTV